MLCSAQLGGRGEIQISDAWVVFAKPFCKLLATCAMASFLLGVFEMI